MFVLPLVETYCFIYTLQYVLLYIQLDGCKLEVDRLEKRQMYVDQEKELAAMTHAKEIEKVRVMTLILYILHFLIYALLYDICTCIHLHIYLNI